MYSSNKKQKGIHLAFVVNFDGLLSTGGRVSYVELDEDKYARLPKDGQGIPSFCDEGHAQIEARGKKDTRMCRCD